MTKQELLLTVATLMVGGAVQIPVLVTAQSGQVVIYTGEWSEQGGLACRLDYRPWQPGQGEVWGDAGNINSGQQPPQIFEAYFLDNVGHERDAGPGESIRAKALCYETRELNTEPVEVTTEFGVSAFGECPADHPYVGWNVDAPDVKCQIRYVERR